MRIQYQAHAINDIFRYFVDGFQLKPGQKIENWETNYDPHTGKVIFMLYVEGKDDDSAS